MTQNDWPLTELTSCSLVIYKHWNQNCCLFKHRSLASRLGFRPRQNRRNDLRLMRWIPYKVQTPGKVRDGGVSLLNSLDMFSSTWVAFRSLFDSLPVLEVADVWLKANFSRALESKWKTLPFYGWLLLFIFKAVFCGDRLSSCSSGKQNENLS